MSLLEKLVVKLWLLIILVPFIVSAWLISAFSNEKMIGYAFNEWKLIWDKGSAHVV